MEYICIDGEVRVSDAAGSIIARLDTERTSRTGAPEAVFAQGKTTEETLAVTDALLKKQGSALITRASESTMNALRQRWPDLLVAPHARCALAGPKPPDRAPGRFAAVVAAGTSDLPVAEEAQFTLMSLGVRSSLVTDVGVAGIHRLLAQLPALSAADAVIAVAGMEGALPTVLAGLISVPVIAVPTSVGYGASFGGIAALLGMLNSCAPGVTVVNIDNGFGAAMACARILVSHPDGSGKV